MPTAEEIRNEAGLTPAPQSQGGAQTLPPVASEPVTDLPDPTVFQQDYAPFYNETLSMQGLLDERKKIDEISRNVLLGTNIDLYARDIQEAYLQQARLKELLFDDLILAKEELHKEWLKENGPSFLERATAFFEEHNFISAAVAAGPVPEFNPDPNYNALNDPAVKGFENYSQLWYLSTSPEETRYILQNIARQENNRKILSTASTAEQVFFGFASGMGSPLTLSLMLGLPSTVAKMGYGAAMGVSVAAGASATAIEEVLIHERNSLRTLDESAVNVVASVLLDSVLGAAAIGYAKTRNAYQQALGDVENYLKKGGMDDNALRDLDSVGAARVDESVEIQGVPWSDPVRKVFFEFMLKMSKAFTPEGKLLSAKSMKVRQLTLELGDVSTAVNSKRGIFSIESLKNKETAETAQYLLKMDELVKRARALYKWDEATFYKRATEALRRADVSEFPEVQQWAQLFRARLDQMYTRAAKAGVPGTFATKEEWDAELRKMVVVDHVPLTQTTSESYARRQWNRLAVLNDRDGFDRSVLEGVAANRARVEADANSEIGKFVRESKKELTDAEKQIKNAPTEKNNLKSGLKNRINAIDQNNKKIGEFRTKNPNDPRVAELEARNKEIRKSQKKLEADIKRIDADTKKAKEFVSDYKARIAAIKERIPPVMDVDQQRTYLDNLYEKIVGLKAGELHTGVEINPSIFKHRQPIDDIYIEDFLLNNPRDALVHITEQLGARIHLQERYGSIKLEDEIQSISDEYATLANNAASTKERSKLIKESESMIDELRYRRDKLLNLHHEYWGAASANAQTWLGSLVRSSLLYNNMRLLGGQLLSSFPEVSKILANYQLGKALRGVGGQIATAFGLMSRVEPRYAQKLGQASIKAGLIKSSYMMETADLMTTGGRIERALQTGSNIVHAVSLQRYFDSGFRGLVGDLAVDELAELVKAGNTAKLLKIGFNEPEIKFMQREMPKAVKEGYLINPRFETWDYGFAMKGFNPIQFKDKLNALILREGNWVVVRPGLLDTPKILDNSIARLITQYKSTLIAMINRQGIRLSQDGSPKFYKAFAFSSIMGLMSYHAYMAAQGKKPTENYDDLAWQVLQRGGMFGFASDLAAMANKIFGVLPDASRYQSRSKASALLGPTFGGLLETFGAAFDLPFGDESTPSKIDYQLKALRKLIPLQNHWALRRALDYGEGTLAEALGGTGKAKQ